jgi:hypothetical protein
MPDILIHAGNLKTGSTAIQAFLFQMRQEIRQEVGLGLPCFDAGSGAHANLARDLTVHGPDKGLKWADVMAEVNALGGPTRHLITSEVFIRAPAAKLAQKLGGFSSIRVLFYLRPHIDMFAAAYAQAVKTGNCMRSAEKAFPRFIASREVDFVAAVEDYLSVFGGDAVQCREYARAHFPGGDVVRDFADFCALPGLAPLAEAVVATERNLSPGAEILSLLLHVRQYLPRKVEAPRALQLRDMVFLPLLRALAETLSESTRYRPPVAIQERLKEQFEPGRRQLGERLGMTPLSAAWYDEPIHAPETPKNPQLDQVEKAFAQVDDWLRLQPEGVHRALLRKVYDGLPTEREGGVAVVSLAALRQGGTRGGVLG